MNGMYAAVTKSTNWPDGYEEVAYLAKQISPFGYTVVLEKKVISWHDGPDCRFVIVHWEHPVRSTSSPIGWETRNTIRTEVGRYDSHDEAATMIRFLIGVERDKRNERN
jgi:hypothetical protein